MNKFCFMLIGSLFCLFARAQHDDHNHSGKGSPVNNEAFDSIKNLVGEWRGTFKWTGASSLTGAMDARYYLTGNGTAVVEDLMQEGKAVMTSVYHLDGDDLRVTHYCAANNQPRLKAGSFNKDSKSVTFKFIDITNLPDPDSAHVSGLQIRFTNMNALTIIFTFTRSGVDSFEQIDLTRS